jgi:hypothetical protein
MIVSRTSIVWVVAGVVVAATAVRLGRLPDPYAAGAVSPVEDRRQYRFRNLSRSETQHLFEKLVEAAEKAPDPITRGRFLARVAALQHERGMDEAARAAAQEALRFAPRDPETRRILASPLELDSR